MHYSTSSSVPSRSDPPASEAGPSSTTNTPSSGKKRVRKSKGSDERRKKETAAAASSAEAEDPLEIDEEEEAIPRKRSKNTKKSNVQNPECYDDRWKCIEEGEPDTATLLSVFLPLPTSKQYEIGGTCSSLCWKSIRDEILMNLRPSSDEKIDGKIELFSDRCLMTDKEEYIIFTSYIDRSIDYNETFCQFAKVSIAKNCKLNLVRKIKTCLDVYRLIMHKLFFKKLRPWNISQTIHPPIHTRMQQQKQQQQKPTGLQMRHPNTLDATPKRSTALRLEEKVKMSAMTKMIPCRHNGPCATSPDCTCRANGTCYMCKCDINCPQRFPGCNCTTGDCKTRECPCYRANQQCDPSTCRACRCDISDKPEMIIPRKWKIAEKTSGKITPTAHQPDKSLKVETTDEEPDQLKERRRRNAGINSMMQKRMKVAPSKIAGNGLFLMEDVEKDDFITEYVGERISDEEAERRGFQCADDNTTYIFNLETDGAIDSFKIGNMPRFANHDGKNATCYAIVKTVSGEQRIGFYAKKVMKANDELTFDYGFPKDCKEDVKKPADASATRDPFDPKEKMRVWTYVYETLHRSWKDGTKSFSPKGPGFWREYLKSNKSEKSADGWKSHFIRQMLPHMYKVPLPKEAIRFLYLKIEVKIDGKLHRQLEKMFKANITIGTDLFVKDWTDTENHFDMDPEDEFDSEDEFAAER